MLMADREEAVQMLRGSIVSSTWDENLHVLPGTPQLEQAERELMSIPGAPYRLADPLAKIAQHYAAIVIDTRPSFSLMTEMALVAATDAIVPVEPRYLETVGLLSVMSKIHAIRDGWRVQNLKVSGILVTKMDKRVKGHRYLLDELKASKQLGRLLCGVIPMNEAVSYAHHHHQSIYAYDPKATASDAYARLVSRLARRVQSGGVA
jgi:chromosome partitioning protein